MRILVTNDDGISSPGIHELARQIEQAGHDVVIVAPDHDASGTGSSLGRISESHPIKVTSTSIEGFAGDAFGIAGPPALCVVSAYLEAFGPVPDIVVSGINAGLNTGRSTLHSGTVGAALAAQNFGMKGLAVSLDSADEWFWESAAKIAVEVLPTIINGPSRGALNLNVPALPYEQIKGIRWAGLAKFNSVRASVSKVQDGHIHFELVPTDYEPHEHTDLGTVREGFAALTSLHGIVEVWGTAGGQGELFTHDQGMHAASAGHELRAAKSVMDLSK